LKKDAIPSQFPNVASYLSTSAPEARSETATSSSRRSREADRIEEAANLFLQEDEVQTLVQLSQKLDRSCLPTKALQPRSQLYPLYAITICSIKRKENFFSLFFFSTRTKKPVEKSVFFFRT
jgi:hypothetical protein